MKFELTEKDIIEIIDRLESDNLSENGKKVIRELLESLLPLLHEQQSIQ